MSSAIATMRHVRGSDLVKPFRLGVGILLMLPRVLLPLAPSQLRPGLQARQQNPRHGKEVVGRRLSVISKKVSGGASLPLKQARRPMFSTDN